MIKNTGIALSDAAKSAECSSAWSKTQPKAVEKAAAGLQIQRRVSHSTVAHSQVYPVRLTITYATLEQTITKIWGCSSDYTECRMNSTFISLSGVPFSSKRWTGVQEGIGSEAKLVGTGDSWAVESRHNLVMRSWFGWLAARTCCSSALKCFPWATRAWQ